MPKTVLSLAADLGTETRVHTDLLDILAGQGLDPEAAQRFVDALPAAGEVDTPPKPETPVLARPRATPRREKCFGLGRPRALDRNAKVRIMHWARCLSRRTEKHKAYGRLTAKFVEVLRALLWTFHNRHSGICFPSLSTIAEAAGCSRATVGTAIKALEGEGLLTWVNRIKRVREPCLDLLGEGGWRWRVLRTSNAYSFRDPGSNSSKSKLWAGTPNQVPFSPLDAACGGNRTARSEREEALRGEGWRNPLPDGVF